MMTLLALFLPVFVVAGLLFLVITLGDASVTPRLIGSAAMIEALVVFLYVIFSELLAWVAGMFFVFILIFYLITLIVEALTPGEDIP